MCTEPPGNERSCYWNFFAIKGVFQLLGITTLFVPFTYWRLELTFPSCGFVYYFINIVIGFVGLVAYMRVARRYQYRQRDEPDNIYLYAEEYYTNSEHEASADYDNHLENAKSVIWCASLSQTLMIPKPMTIILLL